MVCQHFCKKDENGVLIHVFDEGILVDNEIHTNIQYWYNSETKYISVDETNFEPAIDMNELKRKLWVKYLFVANLMLMIYKKSENIEIIERKMKKHKHGKIVPTEYGVIRTTISLSEKGRKYIYTPQVPADSPHIPKHRILEQYTKIPINVKPFIRKQKYGKGRTEIREITIKSFHKEVWISKKDKIVNINA
jgi:uncharacterized protein YuzE